MKTSGMCFLSFFPPPHYDSNGDSWCIRCFVTCVCLQAVRVTSGDLTAVTAASAKTEPSVTPSRGPASAPTGTRGGAVRSPVNMVTTAKHVSYPVSVSMEPPAATKQESASVRRGSLGLCEYQHQTHVLLPLCSL